MSNEFPQEKEYNNNRVLFATIVNRKKVGACLRQLKKDHNIYDNKVFVLNHKDDRQKLILTYNILVTDEDKKNKVKINFEDFLKNTFNIHRKKETDTLYTINSLNIAKEVCGGEIIWDNYKNSLILVRKEEDGTKKLVQIHTSLNNVVDLNTVRDENHQTNQEEGNQNEW